MANSEPQGKSLKEMSSTQAQAYVRLSMELLNERDQALAEALKTQSVVLMTAGPGEGSVAASKKALGASAVEIPVGDALRSGGEGAFRSAVQKAIADRSPVVFSEIPSLADGGVGVAMEVRRACQEMEAAGLKAVLITREPMAEYQLDNPAQAPALSKGLSERRAAVEAARSQGASSPSSGFKAG